MRIAKSIFVGSLAALVLVAVPALAKPEDGRQTGFGLLPSLPAGPRWITDAIVLRRNGRKGTAEGHRARTTNAVSPTGGRALLPPPKRRKPQTARQQLRITVPSHASPERWAKLPNWHRIRYGVPLGAALTNCSRTTCAVRFAHLRDLVQQFWLGHRLPDLRAAVGAFIGEVDLRHDPMRCDVLDVHRQARTAWADNEGWFGVVMVDIGWHVGSPTRHSAVVPDPETRWCFETVNGTLTALLFARDAGGSGCVMARDDARLCGVGFRQLRTCRRTRPGQLWANCGSRSISRADPLAVLGLQWWLF